VTQFELACKAVGATPTIALFRRFFHLAKNGDWLTIQRRKAEDAQFFVPSSPNVKYWETEFFWVSSSLLPFFCFHRDPRALIGEPSLPNPKCDLDHLKRLSRLKPTFALSWRNVLFFVG
jgi:hypothetical protein